MSSPYVKPRHPPPHRRAPSECLVDKEATEHLVGEPVAGTSSSASSISATSSLYGSSFEPARCSAALTCRFPPRFNRWRVSLPDHTGAVARAGLREPGLPMAQLDGEARRLRLLVDHQGRRTDG